MKHSFSAFVLMIAILLGVLWGGDLLMDRTISIDVVAEAPVYSLPPQDYPANNPQVATLKPGQSVVVTRMGYGKDFQAFHIESAEGVSGWVVGGKGVQIHRRG
jgi:hypothetical protein